MVNLDTLAQRGKEEIAPGMMVEWFEQNQIVAYTLNDTNPEGVEKLFARAFEIMGGWPEDRPYLAVYQVGSSQIIITPLVRKHLAELNAYRPDLKGRSAA